jgi:predicted PurR-regulated permease PerM
LLKLELSYRGLLLALATLGAIWLVIQLGPILLLLVEAIVFMVGLLPAVDGLVRKGVPRSVAVIGLLIAILAVTIALFSFLIPGLVREIRSVRDNLPDSAQEVEKLAAHFGIHIELQEKARNVDWDKLISGSAAVNYGQRVVNTGFTILTITAMTAYLLIDMPKLARFFKRFIPPEQVGDAERLTDELTQVVGGYLRGQVITSLIIGIYTFAVVRIVGVPNPLAFGVLAAFADVIPLIGASIAVFPPVAAALQISYTSAIVVFALLELYQPFEDKVLVPRIYGQVLNLPPLVVLLAILAGSELLGIPGVLLALPLTAGGRVVLDYVLERRGVSFSTPVAPLPAADSADDAESVAGLGSTVGGPSRSS